MVQVDGRRGVAERLRREGREECEVRGDVIDKNVSENRGTLRVICYVLMKLDHFF